MAAQTPEPDKKYLEFHETRHARLNAVSRRGALRKGLAFSLVLVLCVALSGALAASENAASPAVPHIDPAGANIQAHTITSQEDAVAYAQALWASGYLKQDTAGLDFSVVENNGVYFVTAGEDANQLSIHFGGDGVVTYLYNGVSHFSDARLYTDHQYEDCKEALAEYLLSFVDALNPGNSDTIEAFHGQEETAYGDSRFVTFLGYTYGGDGEEDDSYSLFVVEVFPEVRVVNYAVGIPMSTLYSGVG
jgi:hypothetical protein